MALWWRINEQNFVQFGGEWARGWWWNRGHNQGNHGLFKWKQLGCNNSPAVQASVPGNCICHYATCTMLPDNYIHEQDFHIYHILTTSSFFLKLIFTCGTNWVRNQGQSVKKPISGRKGSDRPVNVSVWLNKKYRITSSDSCLWPTEVLVSYTWPCSGKCIQT